MWVNLSIGTQARCETGFPDDRRECASASPCTTQQLCASNYPWAQAGFPSPFARSADAQATSPKLNPPGAVQARSRGPDTGPQYSKTLLSAQRWQSQYKQSPPPNPRVHAANSCLIATPQSQSPPTK